MCAGGRIGLLADGSGGKSRFSVWSIGSGEGVGRSYVPGERQVLEVQKGEDEGEKLPDASLTSEAEFATQGRQSRRHCWEWEGLTRWK